LTKEPLSPAVKAGDSQFLDVIRWTIYATWIAEEKGIKSKNVEEVAAQSTDPEVRRLLGVDGDLYKAFGLTPQWAVNVIKAVGNYAEIYDRNLGPETPLKIERGLNNLWNNGGLLYPPPFR
jgi:general L-amino acid transport system substrate-binding protein